MIDRILIVDDEAQFLRSAQLALRIAGHLEVDTCAHGSEALEILRRGGHGIAFLDLQLPGKTGLEILEAISRERPEISVCMVTAMSDVPTAVECMRRGAADYLVKPVSNEQYLGGLRRILEARLLRREAESLKRGMLSEESEFPEAFGRILTASPRMAKIFRYVEAIAPSRLPVLVSGETGTGKEAMARAVHDLSGRAGAFVVVNAAGIDDHLFSDTLFGHVRGAFTGADRERKGMVEEAAGGTLFLDEIGDLRPESQVKLLRLLQEGTYHPLGSDRQKSADVRVVAATHRDLSTSLRENVFRADLYYRLQPHEVRLPPLRERREDLPILARAFVAEACQQFGRTPIQLPAELWTLLSNHGWPGNVRELKGLLFDAVGRSHGTVLSLEPLKERMAPVRGGSQNPSNSGSVAGLEFPDVLPSLKEMEDLLVREALRRTKGNRSQAADLVGMARQTMVRKAKELDQGDTPN
jgi:DNA-binding NtrC family response regulator